MICDGLLSGQAAVNIVRSLSVCGPHTPREAKVLEHGRGGHTLRPWVLATVRASGTSEAMCTTLPFRESRSRNSGATPGAPPENLCCAACTAVLKAVGAPDVPLLA